MSLNFDTLFGPYQDRRFTINYDWVDVDAATGYISYDGFAAADSVSVKYLLQKSSDRWSLWSFVSVNNLYGHFADTWSAQGDYRNLTKILDIDFDTTVFQKARTIKGKAYIKIPISTIDHDLSGSVVTALYAIAKIRKWNGTTETEIVSVQSPSLTTNTSINIHDLVMLSVDVPETLFAINDQLRLTVEVWLDVSTDTACEGVLSHDPQDKANGFGMLAGETRLVFNCPFKIETEE